MAGHDDQPAPALRPGTVDRIDATVAESQSAGQVPALVAAVVRDGALAHVATAGAPAEDLGPDVQYRIGSITKTFTAALVMGLRDEGRLDLDDPLDRHVPGTPVGRVTLRQLLAHVSGLRREPVGDWWERAPGGTVDELLAKLDAEQLAYPAWRGHHYSNLAYGLLGAVVERHTGEAWMAAVKRRILDPLGMSRTTYQAAEPYARGYVIHPWLGTAREEPRTDTGAMAPAGQLWSTLSDLSRWVAFLADPDPAVLSPASVDEMCRPVVMTDLESWRTGQSMGLQMWRRGDRVYVGHTGSMPGYIAVLVLHRASRTGVVAYANAYTLRGRGIANLGPDLLDAVLDGEPARSAPWRPATPPPPADVLPLLGRWWWMGTQFSASFDATAPGGGELVFTVPDAPGGGVPFRFTRRDADTWLGTAGSNDGELLRVLRGPSGEVAALDIATFVLHRSPDQEP